MKATVSCLGAFLVALALSGTARAGDPFYPCYPRVAPDACGPGFICSNYCGCPYGPNYCLRPPWQPFNGIRPNLNNNGPMFGTHPYARSPRDFFMVQ